MTPGTKVQIRWSGKTGVVIPRDAGVADRPRVLIVRLDPFLPQWGNETPRVISNIELICDRRDLRPLPEEAV